MAMAARYVLLFLSPCLMSLGPDLVSAMPQESLQVVKPEQYFDACLSMGKVMNFYEIFTKTSINRFRALDVCAGKNARFFHACQQKDYTAASYEILLDWEHPT